MIKIRSNKDSNVIEEFNYSFINSSQNEMAQMLECLIKRNTLINSNTRFIYKDLRSGEVVTEYSRLDDPFVITFLYQTLPRQYKIYIKSYLINNNPAIKEYLDASFFKVDLESFYHFDRMISDDETIAKIKSYNELNQYLKGNCEELYLFRQILKSIILNHKYNYLLSQNEGLFGYNSFISDANVNARVIRALKIDLRRQ